MCLTFHTGYPRRRHWCPDHRHTKWLGRTLVALTSQTLALLNVYTFHPCQLSLNSTMDKAVARRMLSQVCVLLQCPNHKKRVSQPLAWTATLEPYSMSPSNSGSSEEFLKIQWPGSRRKLRFRPLSGPCGSRPAVKEGLTNVRRLFGSTAPTSFIHYWADPLTMNTFRGKGSLLFASCF